MPRVAAILGISFAACLFLSGNQVQVSAQAPKQAGAVKFDEFGSLSHCNLTARLDNFAIEIQNAPQSKAYIIEYGPEITGNGRRILILLEDYLTNTRGLKADRIETIYGGRNNDPHEPKIQLWVVPKGVQPPEPEKYETNIGTFKGRFSDEDSGDDFGLVLENEDVEEMGPGIGRTTLASFAEMLHQQRDTVGYVVIYHGEDATPGAWRRLAQNEIDILKSFKIDAKRLKPVFGGHRKDTRIQLWILPNDAPAPVPEAGPELPPLKTVNSGDFYASELAKEQNQVRLFTRLAEILREQKTVRVFLVVRLAQPMPDEESEGSEAPVVDNAEPTPTEEQTAIEEEPDLTKLVEKWRVEFAKKHNIGDDRFITLTTLATDLQPTMLSLWIVPRGQPLPDPNEEDKELEEQSPQASPKQQPPVSSDQRPAESHESRPQPLPPVAPVTAKRP